MHLDGWTVLLQTVNFAVLIFLLHRFLYRPVLRAIDARKADVQHQYSEVQALKAAAQTQLSGVEAARAAAAAERGTVLKAASDEAARMSSARQAEAQEAAGAWLKRAREILAVEREAALEESRQAALELGAQVAQRLLEQIPSQLREDAWIGPVVDSLNALPSAQRDALRAQLQGGTPLRVVTAEPLPPTSRERWSGRLRAVLGTEAPLVFDVDKTLRAGVELRFPQARLEFSWRSVLEALREKLDAHEQLAPDAHAQQ